MGVYTGWTRAARQWHVWKQQRSGRVWNNTDGFTFTEALLSLMITMMCAASIPLLYSSLFQAAKAVEPASQEEWALFVIQLRNELYMSDHWETDGQNLWMNNHHLDSMQIRIQAYQNKVRRRVNGKGYEVMLQEIKKLSFQQQGGKLYVYVQFEDGTTEEAAISPPEASF